MTIFEFVECVRELLICSRLSGISRVSSFSKTSLGSRASSNNGVSSLLSLFSVVRKGVRIFIFSKSAELRIIHTVLNLSPSRRYSVMVIT